MHHRAFVLLIASLLCFSGCGPRLVDISGKITYNGEELGDEGCKIVFEGAEGRTAMAPVQPNGDYKAIDVVAGPNKVVVYYSDPNKRNGNNAPRRSRGPQAQPQASDNNGYVSPLTKIPRKYADKSTSGLEVNANSGVTFNANLEGPPIR